MSGLAELLGETGPLKDCVRGFSPRIEQQQMAEATAETIAANSTLIVEAGTGTGKTFAYLMPALLSGKKVIISTGTRHLQDQLFGKDLPVVRKALNAPVHSALLKGRSNYLCWHRLQTVASEGRQLSGKQLHELEEVRAWSVHTASGDIAELGLVSEDSVVWPRVTSTVENCLGQECEFFQDCFVVKARRNAMEADIVVINHHLLFADMVLKEEGFGELLPGADAFIIDEAHQLPEVASIFFGTTLSSHQLRDLARDVRLEHLREAGDMQDLPDAADRMEAVIHQLRLALGQADRRAAWSEVATDRDVQTILLELAGCLQRLKDWLVLATFSSKHQPVFQAPYFRSCVESLQSAWVFTSATLAVGEGFEHFSGQLGLDDARKLKLDSPFNYKKNALLYMPAEMPPPNDRFYVDAVVSCARDILQASKGRAFMLFTSHAALQSAARQLQDTLPYPLLVQGSAPRRELLERFRELGNAVLLGTSSFWEGVDVRGAALSCVIIDKLPFGSPGEPVLQARIEAMREQGENPFMQYQLPRAVINLKQGVGRLIRDENDRGVLVLCDPRLRGKAYGKVFLKSLPDMQQTSSIDVVEKFFADNIASIEEPLTI